MALAAKTTFPSLIIICVLSSRGGSQSSVIFSVKDINHTQVSNSSNSKCVMAAPLVPIFECVSITRAPEGKLPSEADIILLLYNFTLQERKVGITAMCCPIRMKQSICTSEEGCTSRVDQCLMLKVKERWIQAEMPLQGDDFQIQSIMKK